MKRHRKYTTKLGSVVYNIRTSCGWSQTTIASDIGVSMHTIHRIESHGTMPNRKQYLRILMWINRNTT